MELFKLLGTIAIENDSANKALDDTTDKAEKSEGKIGNAFSKIGSAALKLGAVVATGVATASVAIAGLTKNAIENYADYEQLVGGVETLFKDSASTVQKYANDAFKTAGMSANEYMETVTSFSASLLQSLDGDTAIASEKANQAIVDMSDNANKMGSNMESIQNAYQGFAKQNYTMLDNLKLGYGGTKEEMQRLLDDATAISNIEYDISSYADVVDAIHVIQEEMGVAGTTAKEASSTISGSIASTKAAWANLMTAIADPEADVTAFAETFSDSLATVVDNIAPIISKALPGVVQGLSNVVQNIVPIIPELVGQLLPSLIQSATSLISELTSNLPSILEELLPGIGGEVGDSIVSALNSIVGVIKTLLPYIAEFAKALLPAIAQIMETIMPIITKWIETILPPIMQLVKSILPPLMTLIEGVVQILSPIIDLLTPLLDAIMAILSPLLDLINVILQPLIDLFKGVANVLSTVLGPVFEGIGAVCSKIGEGFSWLKDKASKAFSGMKNKIAEHGGGIKGILGATGESMKKGWDMACGALDKITGGKFSNMLGTVKEKMGAMKSKIEEHGGGIKGFFGMVGEKTKESWTKAFTKIDEVTGGKLGNMVSAVKGKMSEMKAKVEEHGGGIKGFFGAAGETIKENWTNAFNKMNDATGGKLGNMLTSVKDKIGSIKDNMATKISEAKDNVLGIFDKIKTGISDKITAAKDTISGIIEKIKGFFKFDFELPKIKLPHFGITPEGWKIADLMKGSIPKLGIEWYAKGGVMTEPTVFGMNGNNAMVGGEAGAEAIAPIDVLQGYVAQAVAGQNAGVIAVLQKILEAILTMDENMGGHMRDALDGTAFEINRREFARLVKAVN